MAKFQVSRGQSNGGIFIVLGCCFLGLLGLFGWQTWAFVLWLFPSDQLIVQILTLFSFDIMAFIWTVTKQFYHFAHPHAKGAAVWGKWITFSCSLIASAIYMILKYVVRYEGTISPTLVTLSEIVSLVVLVVNVLLVMLFLSSEISTRYPNEDEYELVDMRLVGMPRPLPPARLANNQDFNLIEEEEQDNQLDSETEHELSVVSQDRNQLDSEEELREPYTHKGNAKKSWGGPRRGSGRKGK